MLLSAPLTVLFDINSYCQLRCRYCSSMPFNGTEAPTERTVELIKEFGQMNVWYLNFSGGEPFLHPGIMEFIETASSCGIETSINTNGLRLLEDAVLKDLLRLKTAGSKFILSISLDSPDPAANDSARGRGKEVIEAIHRAIDSGLDIKVASVVHSETVDTALDIIETFKGARAYSFFPMINTWAVEKKGQDLLADKEKMGEFWKHASELQENCGKGTIILPFREGNPSGEKEEITNNHNGCFCGFSKCFIDSDLNMYPCDVSRVDTYCFGNLNNSSLRFLWNGDKADVIRSIGKANRLCERKGELKCGGDLPARYTKEGLITEGA